MALVRLHIYAGSFEPSLLADAISTKILCAGPYHIYSNFCMGLRFRSHKQLYSYCKNGQLYQNFNIFSHSARYLAIFYPLQYGPRREKTCLWRSSNNKGADQPAHSCSLISAFVIRFLESTISKLATSEISFL